MDTQNECGGPSKEFSRSVFCTPEGVDKWMNEIVCPEGKRLIFKSGENTGLDEENWPLFENLLRALCKTFKEEAGNSGFETSAIVQAIGAFVGVIGQAALTPQQKMSFTGQIQASHEVLKSIMVMDMLKAGIEGLTSFLNPDYKPPSNKDTPIKH